MGLMFKTLFTTLLKNLLVMVAGPESLFWILGVVAKMTDNKLDDTGVAIVRAIYKGDADEFKKLSEKLIEQWQAKD